MGVLSSPHHSPQHSPCVPFSETFLPSGSTMTRGSVRWWGGRAAGGALFFLVLLEGSHEGGLVLGILEATVSHLGAGVDELQADLLHVPLLGVGQEGFSEGKNSLLVADAGALEHDEVLLHLTVVGEASHGVDGLVSQIVVGGSVVLDELAVLHLVSLSDSVDLLVDLGSVMVSLLTSPGNGELNSARMPGSNTGNLSQTLVSLPGQLLGVPSAGDTLESATLGDTDNIDTLIHSQDLGDGDLLLKVLAGPVNLIGDASSIELDFHDVSLLLPAAKDLHLGVDNHSDHGAVLLNLVQVLLNLLLSHIIGPLEAGLGESLLLGAGPVLVESPLGLLADVLSPHGLEGSETAGSHDVADHADAHDGGSLQDGDGLNHLLLVDLGPGSVHLSHDVSHTSLVSHEAGKVHRLGRIVLGEALHLTPVTLRPLLREDPL